MSADLELDIVTDIVALNGRRLVGRTRFQKTMYLLQKKGVRIPFDFEYHYYGPYAIELADVLNAAVETGQLSESFGRGYHNTSYSIFETRKSSPAKIGEVSSKEIGDWLRIMRGYTGTDLELASTLLYLHDECGVPSHQLDEEVIQLKPVKSTSGGLKRAKMLLAELDLAPEGLTIG